ncbi:unnamed protein product [Ciceribacter selenitireducens ATCC BAA-1503]|uniref:Uncharacterized protein n=1 Tax=Ciceribacter selenitireducens ATCC BAA-1503 TaxID=1336235 RepID=A0A376AHQ1_9HYPH|nr:unnamed protein product [Ciceribacter selenitireducens ATCC BAA-1503]
MGHEGFEFWLQIFGECPEYLVHGVPNYHSNARLLLRAQRFSNEGTNTLV